MAALRTRPAHRAEMSSQILFGEYVRLIERHKDWCRVECSWDKHVAWVHQNQILAHEPSPGEEQYFSYDWSVPVQLTDQTGLVPMGAPLAHFDGMSFKIGRKKYSFGGRAINATTNEWQPEKLIKLARKYLNVPYLLGGRSPHGIDASGLSQMVLRFFGIALPRSAGMQARRGKNIGFVEQAQPGDLVFFSESVDKKVIDHVGIVIGDFQLVHALGKVKIDRINHEGLFSSVDSQYSHYIRCIKRYR